MNIYDRFFCANITLLMKLTTALPGCSGSNSANTWHALSDEDGILATKAKRRAWAMHPSWKPRARVFSNLKKINEIEMKILFEYLPPINRIHSSENDTLHIEMASEEHFSSVIC